MAFVRIVTTGCGIPADELFLENIPSVVLAWMFKYTGS